MSNEEYMSVTGYTAAVKENVFEKFEFNLRLQDRIECGIEDKDENYVKYVLKTALDKSHYSYVLYNDDAVLSFYGVREIDNGVAMPWFLSAEIPDSINQEFLRMSKAYVVELKKKYLVLYNYTYYNNVTAHKWLIFLGFRVMYDNMIEKENGRKLVRFEWRKEWTEY